MRKGAIRARPTAAPCPGEEDIVTKRADGESSIYRDADGRWHGFVSMGKKENGRRDRRHVSAMKRADVVVKVRALEKKRDAGVILESGSSSLTVGAWLEH